MISAFVAALLVLCGPAAAQDSVDRAYQREYAYLAAEKRALQARLEALGSEALRAQSSVETDIARLEVVLKRAEGVRSDAQDALEERERAVAGEDESKMIVDATVAQAAESLSVERPEADSAEAALASLLSTASEAIGSERTVTVRDGQFFQPDGIQLQGRVVHVGRIAAFGVADAAAGPLIPIGAGKFQLRRDAPTDGARTLLTGAVPDSVGLFLFEGDANRVEEPVDRSIVETIEAGGIVAWIIMGLGLLALVLAAFRAGLLGRASAIIAKDEEWLGGLGGSQSAVPTGLSGPIAGAMRKLSAKIETVDRDGLFDMADEALAEPRSRLDRFNTVIMVVAAVAPLLGLLGTVTGMIATFAIITEHGTGDPRMLSGGISEALITTQLGLVVAIPCLLIGNMLGGWSKTLQDRIEQGVLLYINAHAKPATAAPSAAAAIPPREAVYPNGNKDVVA
ncbi:MAG: MotA/TolQ/ExbB proton channel family protein [Myxococcota bacterium]|jgi:biopolymer transport protein ExbB|nr:MotA/TolQ/ExbB proton channel family protein [Myxococcota bacterium]MEC9389760.1 MotA/TolQ/ExbB proton channel family protein [Myxococcota bacterium]